MECMNYINRMLEKNIQSTLARRKSILLLGPRQTGKTTLLSRLPCQLNLTFIRPEVRQRYERHPELLIGEVEALPKTKTGPRIVLVDEVQKVPSLMDVVQDLIDRQQALFVLTGSSARKLKRGTSVNLLPGRVIPLRLDPLTHTEMPQTSLKTHLLYGSLPGIVSEPVLENRQQDLDAYGVMYLEEEVRAEAIVRNLSAFGRFLEMAALDSGNMISFRKLSQELGIAHTTIASYYQVLEDCLLVERIDPLTRSKTRKKLIKSAKYLFFDLGVRRACAREGTQLTPERMGALFEQWTGLELIRLIRLASQKWHLRFWRDADGPEVDWVLDGQNQLIPIEVKWTPSPTLKDSRHIKLFMQEYPEARQGFVVCRTPRPIKLDQTITAIPWQQLDSIINPKNA